MENGQKKESAQSILRNRIMEKIFDDETLDKVDDIVAESHARIAHLEQIKENNPSSGKELREALYKDDKTRPLSGEELKAFLREGHMRNMRAGQHPVYAKNANVQLNLRKSM